MIRKDSDTTERKPSSVYVKDNEYLFGKERLAIIMVGLPARGKSYISKKLRRYLRWVGYNARVYNVGDHRRKLCTISDASFFDPGTPNKELRDKFAMEVLESMISFLTTDGQIAIHDATNSSKERRDTIVKRLSKEPDISVLWIESICYDKTLVEDNIQLKVDSPDYRGRFDKETALRDFRQRLTMYEATYEQLDETDNDKSYVKLIDAGRQVFTNNIHGYLRTQIVTFLMNYNVKSRSIWVTRHGESLANIQGLLGGDSELSANGRRYAMALAKFVEKQKDLIETATLWTSTLIRTQQTGKYLKFPSSRRLRIAALNEIYAGICEGMTYEQIQSDMPEEFNARSRDKLRYRYPHGGESYMDLIDRMKPLIIELERQTTPIFIIGHQAILRTLIGYFHNCPKHQLPHIDVPLHTVFQLTPTPHGCLETKYSLDINKFENEEVFWTVSETFHSSENTHEQ